MALPHIGQQLGAYVLEAEIGRGSMGVVFRAHHAGTGARYAVKVLLDALVTDISFITRFIREARVVSSLRHPNIIRVLDAGRQGDHIYFAMEYFAAVTAAHMLRELGRITAPDVIAIAAQSADALEYAHVHGRLVHRDIKPENILVDRWLHAKVLDFGLARIDGVRSITQAGTVVGSLYYVAPEQLLGHPLDGRADVYALGVSMYELLTGRRPYQGQTLTQMSDAILFASATPPRQIEPSIPAELEAIVGRAMARDLKLRYARAGDLCADLRVLGARLAAHGAQRPTGHGAPASRGTVASGASPSVSRGPRTSLRPATLAPLPADAHHRLAAPHMPARERQQ